jgi:prepilin-type N-terminal cleavage/methylation domain-containing protein
MTNAFTLIEVLVSVMILAVVGTGLLQISSNSKHNFIFLKEKSKFDRLASIAFIHNNQKYHHKNMTLYDFIRDDYEKIDDDLRKYLKTFKVKYNHEEISTFKPLGESTDEEKNQPEDLENPQNQIDLTIIYEKISVQKDKNAAYAYKVYIPMGGN